VTFCLAIDCPGVVYLGFTNWKLMELWQNNLFCIGNEWWLLIDGWLVAYVLRLLLAILSAWSLLFITFWVCMCECKSIQTCGIVACIHPYRLMFINHFTVILIWCCQNYCILPGTMLHSVIALSIIHVQSTMEFALVKMVRLDNYEPDLFIASDKCKGTCINRILL
jgi:small-conductance mechanosensitive channel